MNEKQDIWIDQIETLKNVRTEIGDVSELMASIKQHGLLQPIGLSLCGDKYVVVFGNRRLAAIKKLGWRHLPAEKYVLLPDNIESKEFSVYNTIENIIRKDITPIELGKQCKDLVDSGMNLSEIAVLFSIPKHTVEELINLFMTVPGRFRDHVGYGGRGRAKKTKLPVSIVNKITRSRLSASDMEKMLDWVHAEELPGGKVDFVLRAMHQGHSFSDAKNLLKTHILRHFEVIVDKDTEKECIEKAGVTKYRELYKGIISGRFPPKKGLIA